MLHQLRNRLSSVKEVHSASVQRIKEVQNLNVFTTVTEDLSTKQMLESSARYASGNSYNESLSFILN